MGDGPGILGLETPALAEGAVWERVGGDPLPLVGTSAGRSRLAAVYGEYATVARRWGLPVVLFAPTWRANRERAAAGANQEAVDFVRQFSPCAGALMGPRHDCYDPAAALPREEARAFHAWQAEELQRADFVVAATMPAVSEALGIADVVAAPCLISFVITGQGELLDGTPLEEAMAQIDAEARRRPAGYWLNCVHPQRVIEGLAAVRHPEALRRIYGVQGNTSRLDPRSFAGAEEFASESPAGFAAGMVEIRRRFGIPVLGGCCGTRGEHLEEIARRIATPA